MEEVVGIVERHFGIALVRVKEDEWRSLSGCPQCGDGGKGHNSDRFRLLLNGPSNPRVWCRKCGYIAFVDALDSARPLSEEDKMKLRMAAIERRQEEQQRQMDALQRMLTCQDHLLYHNNTMNGEGLEYWWEEGIQTAQVQEYMLGYCHDCPTARGNASHTIPYLTGGKLYDIRHRLDVADDRGRYRRHVAGLPHMLFHGDGLYANSDDILILEGEKKGIVVGAETGLNYVAVPGANGFVNSWAKRFDRFKGVYVAFDPDATKAAADVARLFGHRGLVVSLPVKADEFFVRCGGTKKDFMGYLAQARGA